MVFFYLNDVEQGGGTIFPDLNITVFPKRGRVLIWPSVVDSDLNEKELRTDHALAWVIDGLLLDLMTKFKQISSKKGALRNIVITR